MDIFIYYKEHLIYKGVIRVRLLNIQFDGFSEDFLMESYCNKIFIYINKSRAAELLPVYRNSK